MVWPAGQHKWYDIRLETRRFRSPKKRQEFTTGVESVKRLAVRQCILANGSVMTGTNLQLVDVSHTTLVQWHNKRVKRQDIAMVMQELDLTSCLCEAAHNARNGS